MATGSASLSYEGAAWVFMVHSRERGNGWCNGDSFSLLWVGCRMDNKGMEKSLMGPSWGRDMSAQIWITSIPVQMCSVREVTWQL